MLKDAAKKTELKWFVTKVIDAMNDISKFITYHFRLTDTLRSLQKEADESNRKIDVIIKRLDSVHWSVNTK